MKAIMYHYVREGSPDAPYFRYLHVEDFRRQLDVFERDYRLIGREEFVRAVQGREPLDPEAVVLTFDDGLIDHYRYVFPELARRGLWGVFYIPVLPQRDGRALDVHKIHYLLGRMGGVRMMELLGGMVEDGMLTDSGNRDFREETYQLQEDNDEATTLFKRTLNYYISYEHRERVVSDLFAACCPGVDLVREIYMDTGQLREMHEGGMLIGSHGVNHLLFSKLDEAAQRREIGDSFAYLTSQIGPLAPKTFCYPYGGEYSFNAVTERLLDAEGVLFTANVESRDIVAEDVSGRPQALPRYDCNEFPHGKARLGMEPPEAA